MGLRLGIDTGGTFTDAVLLDKTGAVLAAAKAETTRDDLIVGIDRAVAAVLDGQDGPIDLVGLSTTLATNAVVEGRGGKAGLVLMGFEPEVLDRGGLSAALRGAPVAHLKGGHDANGHPLAPFDPNVLRAAVQDMGKGVEALAVCGQFAVRNPAHELAAAGVAAELGLPCTLSSSLSARLDAPRRALTALLNARLLPFIAGLLDAVEGLLRRRGIVAPLMVVRGDGSFMRAEAARLRPIETVLSGPAASVVGAGHLTGLPDAVVSDVGGTTTDVAVLRGGRPRLSKEGASVGGWRTMVEAIDMATVGLGGDSALRRDRDGGLALGPERAVPLSLLAALHPGALAELEAELAKPGSNVLDARFALAQVPASADPGLFTRSQRGLLDRLAEGPRSLATIVERDHLEIPLRRLVERGIVLLAGFTPSDAAHVLGLQTLWSRPAAAIGAALEARKGWPGLDPGDGEGLARHVLAEARRRSAAVLVEAVLPEDEPLLPLLRPPLRGLVRAALDGGPGGMALRLDLPIDAVGGPAKLFYPAAAAALDARLVVPEYYAVCNAIGAVAGEVVQTATLVATGRGEDSLTLHLPDGPVEAANPDEARRRLEDAAVVLARRRAAEAGAAEVAVETSVEVARATLDGNREIVMEIRVTATARGRPAIG